ncbi:OLC1v1035572C1 [Oldenlandia corymbosa var. corymbosa]|uniref:OLC1v1035572C1 n=1 Tax=Oldenlandia corymbosa var. corymbosa TaxID=529605 RepID=A0AAV1CTA5_OLDCO|nr:OLC1v1035572C1 [Oldenlandia corymbosa var. corymbosa]
MLVTEVVTDTKDDSVEVLLREEPRKELRIVHHHCAASLRGTNKRLYTNLRKTMLSLILRRTVGQSPQGIVNKTTNLVGDMGRLRTMRGSEESQPFDPGDCSHE